MQTSTITSESKKIGVVIRYDSDVILIIDKLSFLHMVKASTKTYILDQMMEVNHDSQLPIFVF